MLILLQLLIGISSSFLFLWWLSMRQKKNPLNQVIIWDKIIESKEDAHLKDYNVFVKYALIDQGKNLKDNNITLRMYWDHMPLTGRLYVHDDNSGEDSSFIMPSEYTAGKK
mmetsp:Transcript_29151/g.38339  ORF Transcript_29151/g.38339 Transcript_29151/m.38339 type:complete len:111 (+) Transcript_29151:355-687(+)